MAKSITSTLVGAALHDGYIKSLEDQVVRYLPELAGSAYDGVSLRQLLTMTSGVAWNEDYRSPKSDVAGLTDLANTTAPVLVAYMGKLQRVAEPGTRFNYSTGEAILIGHLVRRATGRNLAEYLGEKIWRPVGMESEAFWITDKAGSEVSGCCFNATLRDYGRFGLFVLREYAADGGFGTLPKGWLQAATAASAPSRAAGRPYGFQWWVRDNGSFQASGIFGQMLHIDPKRSVIMVMLSAWARPVEEAAVYKERQAFIASVKKELDARETKSKF